MPPMTETVLSPTELRRAVGISMSYASELLKGTHTPGDGLAVRIWQTTGLKLGKLKGRSDSDVAMLAQFLAGAAPSEPVSGKAKRSKRAAAA